MTRSHFCIVVLLLAMFQTVLSTNTYQQAYTYGETHPTRDGESWDGW